MNLKSFFTAATLAVSMLPVLLNAQALPEPDTAEGTEQLSQEEQYLAWARATWEAMEPKTGAIDLPGEVASLQVPDGFYYLDPTESKIVLEQIWGNPEQEELTLGMLFPAGVTPFDDESWGVTIEYSAEGYIRDDDAAEIDYSELLTEMQRDTRAESEYRIEHGYEAIRLVGWAEPPFYDMEQKKLYWAKEIAFGEMETNTLNYNIRVLGRKGVLVLNFIAGMEQLEDIRSNRDTVLGMASFNEGYRYEEFDPEIDKVAAYGLGALVTGKVLAKTGVLAALLMLLKKFWIVIPLAIGGLIRVFRGKGKS